MDVAGSNGMGHLTHVYNISSKGLWLLKLSLNKPLRVS